MFYIYILKSKKDSRLHTGFTNDLIKRLKIYKSAKLGATKNRRPLELIYYEAYKLKSNAILREKFLKTTKGKLQLRKQLG